MLQRLAGEWPIHLFTNRTDLPESELVRKTRIPLPRRPVFARAILYTLLSTLAYLISRKPKPNLRISSEGAFPFCQISYNQFCHRFFLSRHRNSIAGGWLRRAARIVTHSWGAITEKIAFRSATIVVVPSRGIGREIESMYPSLACGKIRVIPNPVDAESFSRPANFRPAALTGQLGIPPDAFVLSFCALGNFERKGLPFVLEALAGLTDVRVRLIVIGGSSSEVSEYRRLTDRVGVSSSVHFVGLQGDIRPYLWSSQTFVFPSIYEGFALACLQAAAAALPLITTSINGIEEFIIHGENGWIVERTSHSVECAIREAATNPQRTAAMGRAAREGAQMYRQELFQARWLELLKEVTTTWSARARSAEQRSST